jgi:hypothetical protein
VRRWNDLFITDTSLLWGPDWKGKAIALPVRQAMVMIPKRIVDLCRRKVYHHVSSRLGTLARPQTYTCDFLIEIV